MVPAFKGLLVSWADFYTSSKALLCIISPSKLCWILQTWLSICLCGSSSLPVSVLDNPTLY